MPWRQRPWPRALLWLAGLGPFFFLSYNFATWVTAQRAGVPSFYFGWERSIPFLAWTIVPYWSSDLLYAVSLFVCTTRRELDTHAKRLLAVRLISVACFLAFPLKFSFDRPTTDGVFGWLFQVLMGFDRPFNQAPSLHIALLVVLWTRYAAHLSGAVRWAMQAWLVLTGVSTLTTYQHHFIDLPTGVLAGLIAVACFPLTTSRSARRLQLGEAYLTGTLLLLATAARVAGGAWILLWPATALLVVASAYGLDWPDIFGKRNPLCIAILAPYMAAAWANSRWWTRRDPRVQEIAGGVFMGRAPVGTACRGMSSMVDVAAELPVRAGGLVYRSIPMLDLVPPDESQLAEAVEAIEELKNHRPTLVCCSLGYSRSATVVAAWLVVTGRAADIDEAIEALRRVRPRVVLGGQHRAVIAEFAQGRRVRAGGL